jgi:hypothetical protein
MDAILAKSPSNFMTNTQGNLSIVTNKLKHTNFGIHDTEDDVFTVDPDADNGINTTLKALKDFRTPSSRPGRPSSANIQKARFNVRHSALNAANYESQNNASHMMEKAIVRTGS